MLLRSAVPALMIVAASAPAQGPTFRDRDFRVTDIQARLLYEERGGLSVDITDKTDFVAFNSIIGAGDTQENANDLLVTALVVGPGQHNLSTPLIISARDEDGRVLATRRIGGMLAEGRTYRSIVVYDAGCAGVIRLAAQLGTSTRSEQIAPDCGE